MRKLNDQRGISQNLALIGIVMLLVIVTIVGLVQKSHNTIDTGIEYSEPNGPAQLSNSETLYNDLGSSLAFDELRTNLAYFARQTIDQYKKDNRIDVIFVVDKKITQDQSNFYLSGRFKISKDQINIRVDVLNNGKLNLSITDQKTKTNIDGNLPANTKENQFIGSLPITNELFRLEYNPSSKSYTLTALTNNPSTKQQGIDYITSGSGLSKDSFKVLYKPYIE